MVQEQGNNSTRRSAKRTGEEPPMSYTPANGTAATHEAATDWLAPLLDRRSGASRFPRGIRARRPPGAATIDIANGVPRRALTNYHVRTHIGAGGSRGTGLPGRR